MTPRLLPLLGTLSLLGLTAWLGMQAQTRLAQPPALPDTAPPITETTTAVEPIALARPALPETDHSALTTRPLFAPTRRPVIPEPEPIAEAPKEVAPPPPSAPDVTLTGIVGSDGAKRALLSIDEDPAEWFTLGDSINGWTISAMGSDWVLLSNGGQNLRVELFR